jgi:hypothetical protein
VLVVAAIGKRSDTGDYLGSEGTVRCKAAVAGHALRVSSSGVMFTGSQTPFATCTFVVPKALRGKLAKGQLSFGLDNVWATKSFTAKLKR